MLRQICVQVLLTEDILPFLILTSCNNQQIFENNDFYQKMWWQLYFSPYPCIQPSWETSLFFLPSSKLSSHFRLLKSLQFSNSGSLKFTYCLLKQLSPFCLTALYVQQTTRQDEGAVIVLSLPSN